MDDDLRRSVQMLLDIHEIKNLKARYFRCVDLNVWDEFPDLFTEDVTIDFAETTSHPKNKADFLRSVQRHFDPAVSVHHGHAPEIDIIDETHERGVWPMFDLVDMPAGSGYPSHTGYGHYHEQYRKESDGRWRIASIRLTRVLREQLPHTR